MILQNLAVPFGYPNWHIGRYELRSWEAVSVIVFQDSHHAFGIVKAIDLGVALQLYAIDGALALVTSAAVNTEHRLERQAFVTS